ncbi:hypothetical protein ASG87_01445 [Frateuria sp. Soil773]|uniref:hypothetical protein n=1 Tax=Frateuria sp. Soil773 TaxID=1736407 RepID=UPI0006F9261C|nr:hypothetical protein [Frateuria sp. Soil773]KRE90828.1 hypothetical protein ASG87_01445 [Frateuria sp. Soil773]
MPTYKLEISELVHRSTEVLEIEADSLKDAMAELAEQVQSPGFYWSSATRDLMVMELSVDDEVILEDTRTRENGTLFQMWPLDMVEDGRVWEGDGDDGGEYLIEDLPRCVKDLIEAEEDQDQGE